VQTAAVEARLADVLMQRGQYAAADSLGRDALRKRRRALGDAHPDVAASLRQVGRLALTLQDERTGEAYQREAVAVDRRAGPSADSALARDLTELSITLGRHGDAEGAERALREARAAARRSSSDQFPLYLGITAWLAQSLDERTATRAEGEALLRDALAETRARYGDGHAETGGIMASLGAMLVRHGRGADGERLIREALAIHRRTLGPTSTATAGDMLWLAESLTRDGYSAEAERLDRDVVAIYATTFGTSHAAYGAVLGYLSDVIALRGALDSAAALYRRALAIRGATPTSRRPTVALSRAGLASVLTRQGRFAEADTLFRQALDVMVPITTERNMNVRRIYGQMATLYEAWGKPDSAARFRRLEQPPGYTRPWVRWR
jgi:serine/threonine-protein kinase